MLPLVSDVYGKGRGDPLVFVHGFALRKEVWSDVASLLQNQHEVHALDLPGFGATRLPETPVSLSAVGERVAQYCAEQDLRDATFIGHSMGVRVVVAALKQLQQNQQLHHVRSMLLSHPPPEDTSQEQRAARASDAQRYESYAHMHGSASTLADYGARAFTDAVSGETIRKRPELYGKVAELVGSTPTLTAAFYQRAVTQEPQYRNAVRALHDAGVEVGVFTSKADEATPPEAAQCLKRAIPGTILSTFPSQTHMPMLHIPGAYANAVDQFDYYARHGSLLPRNRM